MSKLDALRKLIADQSKPEVNSTTDAGILSGLSRLDLDKLIRQAERLLGGATPENIVKVAEPLAQGNPRKMRAIIDDVHGHSLMNQKNIKEYKNPIDQILAVHDELYKVPEGQLDFYSQADPSLLRRARSETGIPRYNEPLSNPKVDAFAYPNLSQFGYNMDSLAKKAPEEIVSIAGHEIAHPIASKLNPKGDSLGYNFSQFNDTSKEGLEKAMGSHFETHPNKYFELERASDILKNQPDFYKDVKPQINTKTKNIDEGVDSAISKDLSEQIGRQNKQFNNQELRKEILDHDIKELGSYKKRLSALEKRKKTLENILDNNPEVRKNYEQLNKDTQIDDELYDLTRSDIIDDLNIPHQERVIKNLEDDILNTKKDIKNKDIELKKQTRIEVGKNVSKIPNKRLDDIKKRYEPKDDILKKAAAAGAITTPQDEDKSEVLNKLKEYGLSGLEHLSRPGAAIRGGAKAAQTAESWKDGFDKGIEGMKSGFKDPNNAPSGYDLVEGMGLPDDQVALKTAISAAAEFADPQDWIPALGFSKLKHLIKGAK
jgi:hypothetical protein